MCTQSSSDLIDDSDDDAIAAELESLETLVSLSPEVVQLLDQVRYFNRMSYL